MGNYIGTIEEYGLTGDEIWEFYYFLSNRDYPASVNKMLKKERKRLYDAYNLAKTDTPAAEKLIRQIYKDNGLDIEGEDNEVCYAIGDSISIALGRKPNIQYAED